jgi:hypothetical protein
VLKSSSAAREMELYVWAVTSRSVGSDVGIANIDDIGRFADDSRTCVCLALLQPRSIDLHVATAIAIARTTAKSRLGDERLGLAARRKLRRNREIQHDAINQGE